MILLRLLRRFVASSTCVGISPIMDGEEEDRVRREGSPERELVEGENKGEGNVGDGDAEGENGEGGRLIEATSAIVLLLLVIDASLLCYSALPL